MDRKTKILILFIQIIGVFALGTKVLAAAPKVNSVTQIRNQGDLYYVKADANGGTIKKYVVGATVNAAISFITSSTETYITVPNGTYNVWAVNTSDEYSEPYRIYVNGSCSNTSATDKTNTGYYERCFERYSNGQEIATTSAVGATCAAGYNMDAAYSTISYNDCGNKDIQSTGLQFRYCTKRYSYKCVRATNGNASSSSRSSSSSSSTASGNAKLSSLSISTGSLSPNFSASTYTYSATTSADSVTINATLANGSASFISGYGPRTVSLNYGTNTIQIRTQDGNSTNTYTLKIKRSDGRSSANTLSSLSVSKGNLEPSFSALTNSYNVKVDPDVESVDISAALADSNSSFVSGYGPRTVKIDYGYTRASIKVKSQSGNVRTYTILFGRDGGDGSLTISDRAVLESLELSAGTIDFDSKTFDYNISVPYDVTNISVRATAKDKNDKVEVTGGDNLEEDKLNEITISVTSSDGAVTNTYTIYVTRKEEDLPISNNSLLSNLEIEGYKIKFDAKKTDYSLNIKEGISELNITAIPSDDKSVITIEGNENLTNGSKIKIRVTAEDGSYTDYFVEVKVVGKGGNVILTIFVILLIIVVLAYLVLRAMGYKIYFNLDGIKQIISNFKKKK